MSPINLNVPVGTSLTDGTTLGEVPAWDGDTYEPSTKLLEARRQAPLLRSGRINLPEGVKLRGANITVKAGANGWPDLFVEWDWAGWIKPQIDRAIASGANCIRLIGGVGAIVGGISGTGYPMTRSTWLARWTQLFDYLLANRVYAYPCGGDHQGTNTLATSQDEIVELARLCKRYPNVIGLDVWQEGSNSMTAGQAATAAAAIRAVAPEIPLTFSHVGLSSAAGWADNSSGTYTAQLNTADFLDWHVYYDGLALNDPNALFANISGKPLIIGEFGANQGQLTAARAARYSAMRALVQRHDVLGALNWAMADQSATTSNQWGLYDNSGTRRADMADVFETFPRYTGSWRHILKPSATHDVSATTGLYTALPGFPYTLRLNAPCLVTPRVYGDLIGRAGSLVAIRPLVDGVWDGVNAATNEITSATGDIQDLRATVAAVGTPVYLLPGSHTFSMEAAQLIGTNANIDVSTLSALELEFQPV